MEEIWNPEKMQYNMDKSYREECYATWQTAPNRPPGDGF